jgi:Holliday junction DNA helicase RuvA
MDLFGFKDRDDLELFRILLGVNGIGPKLALTVLSRLAPEELESAVAAQDVSRFKGISGIGAKTAEKIVFELKGKFKHARSPAGSTGSSGDDMLDLRLALQSLGYTAQEIDRALRSPEIRKAVTLEDRIRAGLTLLAGGRKL